MRSIAGAEQERTDSPRGRGRTGAALVIALAASAVVLLSVTLLLGYISRMTREQAERESLAQARLSQASACDLIASLMGSGQAPFTDDDGFLHMAGQTTRIAFESRADLPPIRVDFAAAPGMERFVPVESSGGIALVGIRDGRLEAWEFDPRTGSVLSGFPVDICEASGGFLAAGFGRGSGWLLAAASEAPGGVRVLLAGPDGSVIEASPGIPSLEGYTRAEAGMAGGQPVMILSGASGSTAVFFASGETAALHSPAGTCPVVTGGAIWPAAAPGEAPGQGSRPPVLDVMRGDWDADGSEDVCWISPTVVSVLLSSEGKLVEDSSPGASPGAWGDLEDPAGLAVRWTTPAGVSVWRSLSSGRFTSFIGGGALALPWEGRLSGGRGLVAGSMDGAAVLYTASGRPLATLGASPATALDIDGGAADLVFRDGDGWSAVLDPSDGPGETLAWRLTTVEGGGSTVLSGRAAFSVFRGTGGGTRLYRECS